MPFRERVPAVFPRSCGGRVSCVFFLLVPMLGALALAGLWMYRMKMAWEEAERKASWIREHTLQMGQLMRDFNVERELTAVYVTARSMESQLQAKEELDEARRSSDYSLSALPYWPGLEEHGHMYKSRYLFQAVLNRHRELVKVGIYYQDEIQFYTNLLDIMFSWVMQEVAVGGHGHVWQWLLAYSYLLGSINYLGAEQALCSVFFSMICFSYRETFTYANYSFSGEAAFRMYRQMYPGERGGGWRTASHHKFFPALHECREEIMADLTYQGMAMDPSLCDESRKNETRFHDTDILTLHETQRVTDAILGNITYDTDYYAFMFIISIIILGALGSYFLLIHILRCIFIKCVQSRNRNNWGPKDASLEEDKLDSLTLESKMTKYDDFQCKPNAINVRVATV